MAKLEALLNLTVLVQLSRGDYPRGCSGKRPEADPSVLQCANRTNQVLSLGSWLPPLHREPVQAAREGGGESCVGTETRHKTGPCRKYPAIAEAAVQTVFAGAFPPGFVRRWLKAGGTKYPSPWT